MKNLLAEEKCLREETNMLIRSRDLSVTDCGDGVFLRVCDDISDELFDRLVEDCSVGVPQRLSHTKIAGNRFLYVEHDEDFTYFMYFPARRQVRILFGEKGGLVPDQLGEKARYNGEKSLTQVAPNDAEKNFGMCYIFSLGEGHFLIYDGLGDRGGDEVKIFDSLTAATPEGKRPVVDAWILTHPHFDHIAGVHRFAQCYADAVEVRSFVMNMAAPERYPVIRWKDAADCYAKWLPGIFAAYPEAKVWKVHTGQSFSVGDARIEVLYTQEEDDTGALTVNNSSLVTRVFFCGKSFFFPDDIIGEAACQLIHDLYGSYLKSDFYQTAHHGFDTHALSFYYDVDPEEILWPLRARDWDGERIWTFPATQVYAAELKAGKRKFHITRGESNVIPLR